MTSITVSSKKRSRGRPPTGIGKVIGVRFYPGIEAALDAYIANQRELIGRPEAIRRLVEIGLKAGKRK